MKELMTYKWTNNCKARFIVVIAIAVILILIH